MRNRNTCSTAVLAAALVLAVCGIVLGQGVFKAEVIDNEIVVRVEGVNGRALTWKDAKQNKGIIVSIKAEVPRDMELWATDFSLKYFHADGEEDRGHCGGLQTAVSSKDDAGVWIISKYANTSVKQGTRYLKLLFPIGNDVTQFTLHHAVVVDEGVQVKRE